MDERYAAKSILPMAAIGLEGTVFEVGWFQARTENSPTNKFYCKIY